MMYQLPVNGDLIRISHWSTSVGLPSWHIWDMANDRRGLVWLATDKGLVSLNGRSFTVHALDMPAPQQKNINRIAVDARQNIWLFCPGQSPQLSIYIYDPYRDRTQTFAAYTACSLVFHQAMQSSLYEADGKIWLLDPETGSGGYFGPDLQWHGALDIPSGAAKQRAAYYPANNNSFWRVNARRREIALIDARGALLKPYPWPANGSYTRFRPGRNGDLYLLGWEGRFRMSIVRCNPEQGLTRINKDDMLPLSWANTGSMGYQVGPIWQKNNRGYSLSWQDGHDPRLRVYAADKLLSAGLDEWILKRIPTHLDIRVFALDDGTFWLTGSDALFRIEIADQPFKIWFSGTDNPPSTRGITTLGGRLFVNSYQGTFEIDQRSGKARKINQDAGRDLLRQGNVLWSGYHHDIITAYHLNDKTIDSFVLDANGTGTNQLFLSAAGKLYASANDVVCLSPGAKQFKPLGIGGGATCFHENRSGLWVGGSGLRLLDSLDHLVRDFSDVLVHGGGGPFIKAIYEDGAGVFWLATEQGLWRWRPFTNDLRVFDAASNGFPSDKLHAVFEDGRGRLWIPSDGGLLVYDIARGRFQLLTQENGLPGSEFNWLSAYRSESGHLYLGGVSGLVSFHPDSISIPELSVHPLQLLRMVIKDDQSRTPNRNLTWEALFSGKAVPVPAGAKQIEIGFCVPAFSRECLQYGWRIPVLDSAWHTLAEPNFTIFNLPYGNYDLELAAVTMASRRMHPATTLRIPIEVARPYYLQYWFLGVMTALLLGLIGLAFRIRQYRLRRHNQRLAQEVAAQTVQLKQERDTIARQADDLKRLDAEKMRFFQDLSHEIRNPLTLILGPTGDMLKSEDLPPRQADRLKRIRRNAQKIQQIVDEVHELTKLETGIVALDEHPVALAPFLERIFGDFEGEAWQKQVVFRLEHSLPETGMVRLDARKFEKILNNIIQNALKFTPGGGRVTVSAGRDAVGILTVDVRDTGIGIAPEYQERIFERYWQVPASERRLPSGGFGIGLAMCRSYAQLMNGHITVESTLGRGTLMRVVLPCPEALPEAVVQGPAPAPGAAPAGNARILLVDDDAEILDYIAGILSAHYEVFKAGSGEAALAWLAQHPADLVISDLVMPGLSGLQMLAMLRRGGPHAAVPFILLTGHGRQEDMLEAQRLDCSAYLTKPADEKALLEAARMALQHSRREHGSREVPGQGRQV